jgi:hypothetical protein
MTADIVEFERQAETLSRRASEVLAGRPGPPPADEPTRRRRQARKLRQSIRAVVSTAASLAAEWPGLVRELKDFAPGEQLSILADERAIVDEYMGLLARGRELWSLLFADSPDAELMAEVARGEDRLLRTRRQMDAAVEARTNPFVPLDPERYAAAVRSRDDGPWVSAKDAIARFRGPRS